MHVVVVESPAKAKTINKYLGNDYKVLASYGHIRDLPPKDGSVRPDDDFAMEWEVDGRSQRHVKEIAEAIKGADTLYLATDPDREGEAISWHVQEVLAGRRVLKGVDVKRVVFHEITKGAVQEAMANPRGINEELVQAYLARRALDYLVGFTLSPVLWRKLPGARSAGRVQSVALRLICERESEIETFVPREYWTVGADFDAGQGQVLSAGLTHLDGRKLGKHDIANEAEAKAAVKAIETASFRVATVERKQSRRNPAPPFTTSTLQQEASRKLGFSAKRTMQLAQRLYEGVDIGGETVGLITYMRTDAVNLSGEAINGCRRLIEQDYAADYLPESPRVYKTKAKNAQEAHEAIRPTDAGRRPRDVARHLDDDLRRLYELVWKRTVASQMASAVLNQVAVDIASADGKTVLRATGSVVVFDGFLTLYQEGRDDEEDEAHRRLPDVREGAGLERRTVKPEQHFTQPPPRYTEASLVKTMEELGIGRPSTYASILSVLQDRNYVRLDRKRFVPEDRGRLVTTFLTSFFERYVQYNFTADLENKLDQISNGDADWKAVLRDFWSDFNATVEQTSQLRMRDVVEALDEELGAHFFRTMEAEGNPRACPNCEDGRLSLKLGKFGAFIGCSNYPECRHTRPLTAGSDEAADDTTTAAGPKVLGTDPETGLEVTLRKGPYGHYVQLGEQEEGSKKKPKRASLPRGLEPAAVDLERALKLLALPRDVGPHPETGEMITAGIGRYGPYVHHGGVYVSLKGDDDVLTIGMNRAVDLLAEKGKSPAKSLGEHPEDKKPVTLHSGRFGSYVQHNKLRATLPKDVDADSIDLARAVEILAAKAARGGKGGAKKAPAKKAATKKTTSAKKTTTKKTTAKKTTAKKTAAKKTAGKKTTTAKKAPAKNTTTKKAQA